MKTNLNPSKISKPTQLIAFLCIAITGEFIIASLVKSGDSCLKIWYGVSAIVSGLGITIGFFVVLIGWREKLMDDKHYLENNRFTNQFDKQELIIENEYKIPSINLNDLIEGYKNILISLEKLGYSPVKLFGSTSTPPVKPKYLILVFGRDCDLTVLKNIIELLTGYKLAYIKYSPDFLDQNTIYIGAYNFKDHDLVEWEDAILQKLNNANSLNDFIVSILS